MVHTLILSSIINIFICSSAYLDAFSYNSTILPGCFRVSQMLVLFHHPEIVCSYFFIHFSYYIHIGWPVLKEAGFTRSDIHTEEQT